MGKSKGKGKARSNYRALSSDPAPAFDKKKSRINRLETAQDAFGGDEDDFHKQRDQILFEDDGRAANQDDLDDVSDEDEIYALNLSRPDSEEDDEVEDDEEGDDDDDDDEEEGEDTSPLEATTKEEEPRGRFAKKDVPADSDASEDDEEEATKSDSDEEEQWTAGQYHATRRAPGEADSSDEEAEEMELEEARRLQKKLRGQMEGEDFGLAEGEDDVEWESAARSRLEDAVEKEGQGEEAQNKTAALSEEEAIAYLLREKPETLALVEDFGMAAERLGTVEKNLKDIKEIEKENGVEHPARAMIELEHQALTTYLPTLTFFFSLLLSPSPSSKLVESVLERLASLRTALATMEEHDLVSGDVGSEDDDEDDGDDDMEEFEDDEEGEMLASEVWDLGIEARSVGEGNEEDDDSDEDAEEDEFEEDDDEDDEEGEEDGDHDDDEGELDGETKSILDRLTDDELQELMDGMDDEDLGSADKLMERVKEMQLAKASGSARSRASAHGVGAALENGSGAGESGGKKRKRGGAKQRAKMEQAEAGYLNLVPTLAPLSSKAASKLSRPTRPIPSASSSANDFLDPTSLSLADLADKASARHSLRFHVSQVNQKSAKRAAGPSRIGGDDDLPRRSKERSRREVLKRQEHGGNRDGKGEALDGEDWGEEDLKRAGRGKSRAEEGEEYYDLVKSGRDGERKQKKESYDQERKAEKAALDDLSLSSADGPRGATRKILANKGLQPKRAKVNRNPRVKKRLRYDKAVKKVATMKSVYSGKEASKGQSDYQGERSGIGKNVVKSVRLSK